MRQILRIQGRLQGPDPLSPVVGLDIENGRIRSLEPQGDSPARGVVLTWTEDSGSESASIPGARCLPAFVDGHTHLVGQGLGRLRPDLSETRSADEALARLEAWLDAHPGNGPVIAEGWDHSRWDPSRPLAGTDLDRLGQDRAIAARRVCGHVAAFNRPALEALGHDWADLDVGSGTAKEELPLALTRLWPPTEGEYDAAVLVGQETALRLGVGWIHEMGDRSTWSAFRRADVRGELRIRVSHFFRCEGREALDDLDRFAAQGLGLAASDRFQESDHLRFAGIKLFLDGSIGARSAAVRDAYPEGGGSGLLVWSDEDLQRAIEVCCARNWPVAAHAIGDRAVEQFLRILERTGVPGGIGPRIEHAEMLPPDLFGRAVRLGAFLSMQPNFTGNWQGPGGLYEQVLGPARSRSLNRYADAARSGRLLFGSDSMPMGPLLGIRGAETHPDPEQRLETEDAFLAYTAGSARAVWDPFHRASIEEGEPANFVIVGGGGTTGDADAPDREVLGTILGGDLLGGNRLASRPEDLGERA